MNQNLVTVISFFVRVSGCTEKTVQLGQQNVLLMTRKKKEMTVNLAFDGKIEIFN